MRRPSLREHTQSDESATKMLKISLAHIIDLCLLYGECRFIVIYSVYIVYKKLQAILAFISFPARGDFCRPLIAFANIFDPDQLPHNGMIWININGHFDGTSEIVLSKKMIKRISRRQKHARLSSNAKSNSTTGNMSTLVRYSWLNAAIEPSC